MMPSALPSRALAARTAAWQILALGAEANDDFPSNIGHDLLAAIAAKTERPVELVGQPLRGCDGDLR